MSCFDVLRIEKTKDKKVIRHAYAELVKIYHMETHPKEFEQIKEAYGQAMEYADSEEIFSEDIFKNNGTAAEDNQIQDNTIEHVLLSLDNISEDDEIENDSETDDAKNIPAGKFFETQSEELYGNTHMAELNNLNGIQKIREDLENQQAGGFNYFKDYVLSAEFLKYQYDKYYIKLIGNLLTEYAEKQKNSQILNMFLPFGIMYGVFGGLRDCYTIYDKLNLYFISEYERHSDYLESDDLIPLIQFAGQYIDADEVLSRCKKEDIKFFLIAANKYRVIAEGYGTGYYTPGLSQWNYALSFMDYEVYPYVHIKNDYSIWVMTERLILNHPDIDLEILIWLADYFHMADVLKTSKKKIFEPVVRAIENVTGIKIEILAGKEAYINTPDDYSKLLCTLVDESGIDKVRRACRRDAFLTARKDEVFTENLLKLLRNGDIGYELWAVFFESYYFTGRGTETEEKVMECLNGYTDYIEGYWQEAENSFAAFF